MPDLGYDFLRNFPKVIVSMPERWVRFLKEFKKGTDRRGPIKYLVSQRLIGVIRTDLKLFGLLLGERTTI